MLVRKLATVFLALGILGTTAAAFAQDNVGQQKDKTLVDRLDNLGKAIFGGILPADKTKPKAGVSAYKAATSTTKPLSPFAKKK